MRKNTKHFKDAYFKAIRKFVHRKNNGELQHICENKLVSSMNLPG